MLLGWSLLLMAIRIALNQGTYVAPGNMQYPFGDENQMGTDVAANDTNTVVCRELKEYEPEFGRCPFPPSDLKLADPYVRCPQFPSGPRVAHREEEKLAFTDVLCKQCDVQLTPDGAAINLKCLACLDLPSPHRSANLTEKDVAFTAYYVEIANYTSVLVQGTENF